MTNRICLIVLALFGLSFARQIPKECTKGPEFWCRSLKNAGECGSVGHCIATVWETQNVDINRNEIADKFITLFKELKEVNDLINEDYLAQRVKSACSDIRYPEAVRLCRERSLHQEQYMMHVLSSNVSAETTCRIVGMCNNMKIDNIIAMRNKKSPSSGKQKEKLIGADRCTWGPSYWCSNFSTGRDCRAMNHCIQKVWSNMKVADDKDSICQICTDMVKQARDQLESNQTQEELKEVFEGSCNLIPIKLIRSQCLKLADDFVPELVETLASQMNPQVVCSVAGLCNNEEIDILLKEYHVQLNAREECSSCKKTVIVARKRFEATTYEDFLTNLLQVCRKMGSLTDSCSMLVFKYYENIIAMLKKDLEPQGVCHLSGQCAYQFHSHDEFIFKDDSKSLSATDDVPCEFCEQLVKHLRDILVANTTEVQFYRVLKGICNQTGNFKVECLHLVEQYYPVIYSYLLSDLNPKELCALGGICPNNVGNDNVVIAPLVPKELTIKTIASSQLIGTDEANAAKVISNAQTKKANVQVIGTEAPQQLPLERMFVNIPQTKSSCAFCEYFLHYIQIELSDTKTEEKIRDVVDKACDRLPKAVQGECKEFVSEYGPAVIALLVQEIDPSSICPALGLCPQTHKVRRVSINSDKPNCPLCLFAVMQLEAVLKNNHTEANIRAALDGLCSYISVKLRSECIDFVDAYSNQLVEMLIANMDAQEICVYLKLCKDTNTADPLHLTYDAIDRAHEMPYLVADRNNQRRPMLPTYMLQDSFVGDIETNEIPDNTINGQPFTKQKTVCVVCEFVMKEIDDQIKDKQNEDEVKKIVHNVCQRLPKSVRSDCNQFVDKYADLVISLLAQELDPSEVCQELKLCDPTIGSDFNKIKGEILDCAVCETVVMAVKKVLKNKNVDHNVVHVVEKACSLLPSKYYNRCQTMMEIYGDSVIHLVEDFGAKAVCEKIGICSETASAYVEMHKEKKIH